MKIEESEEGLWEKSDKGVRKKGENVSKEMLSVETETKMKEKEDYEGKI